MKTEKKESAHYLTGKLERFNYSIYFLGQGMTYILCYSFLQQYALDIGISALLFAGVAFAIKGGTPSTTRSSASCWRKSTSRAASICRGSASPFS